jgi:hypothetical protein
MKYNHIWEEVENAGRLYNVAFSIDYYVTPHRPAKIHCDPDDGHPEEPSEVVIDAIDVVSVEMVDVGMIEKVSSLEKLYWTSRFNKQIDDGFKVELAEHLASYEEAAREEADEARAEQRREDRGF